MLIVKSLMLISSLRFRPAMDKLKGIISWVILCISLVSCGKSWVTVAEISPQKSERTIFLKGRVSQVAPLIDRGAYQLDDGTGKIWVVTSQTAPQLGEEINLRGKIKFQSLPFAEQELGELYLIELEQLTL